MRPETIIQIVELDFIKIKQFCMSNGHLQESEKTARKLEENTCKSCIALFDGKVEEDIYFLSLTYTVVTS